MSQSNQSTVSPGNFILLNNSNSSLDKYLINKDYLLKRINDYRTKKISEHDTSINTRKKQIAQLQKVINSGTLDAVTLNKYNDMIVQLNTQISKIENQNVNPSFSEIDKSHFIFLNTVYKPIVAVGYSYSKVNAMPLPLLGSSGKVKIPIYGDFFTDMVLNFKIGAISANNKNNKVKYCDFPGHRLLKSVRFVIDGSIIDEYTTEDINFHYQFHIPNSQKNGWKRCVGQETSKRCFFTQDPNNQEVREEKIIYDGYQTPKRTQPSLEMFIPLNFWFCEPTFAMSNNNITYDKAFIEFDLAAPEDLLLLIDYEGSGDGYSTPVIEDFNLYTNHIYLIPEIVELFQFNNTFNIIRLHKKMERIVNKSYDELLLTDIKFAVEQMYVLFRPLSSESDENSAEIWYNNNAITYTEIPYPSIIKIAGVKSMGYTNAYYYTETPVVDELGIICSGNNIYDNISSKFYDSYLPYRYGKNMLMTPNTSGSYIITFNLYPDNDQPSGYLNLSNSRENYLSYTSSYISGDNPCKLYISTKTINFLYLSEGSMTVRFST